MLAGPAQISRSVSDGTAVFVVVPGVALGVVVID
jgi:hypothetical protein